MRSLNIFRIDFDRSNAVYIAGDTVSGCVVIDLAREKVAEALTLWAKGEANVSWTEQQSTKDVHGNDTSTTVYHTGHELYFSLTVSLLEKSKDDRKVHIPAGLSKYPFSIQLPHNLPCSFEHNTGHIRYTIKAVIARSWRFDHECKTAFTVITPYDLNIRRELCIGIYDDVNEAFSCCCCFTGDSINMQVKLPMTGFVPGQWIDIVLEIKDTTELQTISVKLEQHFKFHATTSVQRERAIAAAVDKKGPFQKQANIVLNLFIPSIPPSELEFCNIIDLKYVLHLVLRNSDMCKITRQYPILIGSIPLRPIPSAPVGFSSYASTSTSENVIPESDVVPSAPSNEFHDPPPSYEECCTNKASSIKEPKDSTYVYGANEPFAPKYPVFKFPT